MPTGFNLTILPSFIPVCEKNPDTGKGSTPKDSDDILEFDNGVSAMVKRKQVPTKRYLESHDQE